MTDDAEKGKLTNEKLQGVFKALAKEKFTGTLSVWDDTAWKEFYFAGTGVRATSVGARKVLPLGEYLVRRGFVDAETVAKALETQQTNFTMLGEILVDQEALEPARRDKALRWQLQDELADLFFWPRPSYEYRPGPQTGQYSVVQQKRAETQTKSLSVTLPAADALRAARETFEELQRIRQEVNDHGVYRLTELGRQKLFVQGGFKALSDPEQRVVVLLDGKRDLQELMGRALVLPDDVLRIVHKLQGYGAVKLA